MAQSPETHLYNTLKKRNPNLEIVRELIGQDVDCNLSHFDGTNRTFIFPILLAAKNDRHNTLYLLYERRNSPTQAQLDKHLIFYINHYDRSNTQNNEILFDFVVSRLLYFRFFEGIFTIKSKKYAYTILAGLHDLDGAERYGESLSRGCFSILFLQLRIYTLFRNIIDMKNNPDNKRLTIVKTELLHNLETYYFVIGIKLIPVEIPERIRDQSFLKLEFSERELLKKYYECIANNVIRKIDELEINEEYTIPTGWQRHAVCVSFRRVTECHIIIRIDNPTSRNPPNMHETEHSLDGHTRLKPKVLGRLHVTKLKANLNYFVLLIDSVNRKLTPKDGQSLLYNLNGQILHLDETLIDDVPSFIEQANANCFLKCFEPGFRLRLGERHKELCEDLVLCEKNSANLLAIRCEEETQQYLNDLFYRFNLLAQTQDMTSLPATAETRLQDKLKASYRQQYKRLSNETDNRDCPFLNTEYVPLRFEYDRRPIELKHFFIKPRVLMQGEAGSGKTTVCQHIIYSWAVGDLWRNQFKWLFHIKMRNLNSQRYPLRSSNYSLIDIIEKECFPEGGLEHSEDKERLKHVSENSSKILWILDGYDERKIPKHLRFIDQKLLAQSNLLLTSRLDSSADLEYDVKIQIQNFTENDIETYVRKYFPLMFRTTSNACWSFIRNSDQLRRTARIPACLQIICSLWEKGRVELDVGMTMGQLYQKMCDHLLRQYLLKFHRLCNSSLAGRDIYREPNAIAFTHLEHLAFKATKAHRLTITEEEINDVAGPQFRSILQIVLLIPQTQNSSNLLIENIYYFVHRSFQEHLSARYMIKMLESPSSNEHKKSVFQFIINEKYNRRMANTFHSFFQLERSNLCTNQFWLAVDSQPRDLIGLRHCSRIAHWLPKKLSEYVPEDRTDVNKRTIDIISTWILNTNRLPHDIGNKYIFESFVGATGRQCWLDAWKADLFLEDSSKRRYFLPDLWSTENIDVLRNKYNDILEYIDVLKNRDNDLSKDIEALHDLIRTGPNLISVRRLNLESDLFNLYTVDDPNDNILEFLISAQKHAKRHEPITTSADFKKLLENYASFANLNRQSAALGSITWGLKIDPSALTNIDNETLHLLLQLTERQALFFRYSIVPVIPFLKLYANQNGLNQEYLRSLIVSITMSSICILTVPPNQTNLIRVHENETYVDIEMNERRRSSLIEAFGKARDAYGYSLFF